MSAIDYSSEIRPEQMLRRFVLASAALMAVIGAVIILFLPVFKLYRPLAALAWLLYMGAQICRTAREYRRSESYRIYADGSVTVNAPDGQQRMARFAAGSLVLSGLAWLRVCPIEGRTWGELVRASTPENQQWRRFQVICRHMGAC